jgi:hypothetical protein
VHASKRSTLSSAEMTRLKNQIAEASNSGTRLGLDAAEQRPGAQDSMIMCIPYRPRTDCIPVPAFPKIIGRLRAGLTKL